MKFKRDYGVRGETLYRPCVVCGEDTGWCCSDCAIERELVVHVCPRTTCQEAHEHERPARGNEHGK